MNTDQEKLIEAAANAAVHEIGYTKETLWPSVIARHIVSILRAESQRVSLAITKATEALEYISAVGGCGYEIHERVDAALALLADVPSEGVPPADTQGECPMCERTESVATNGENFYCHSCGISWPCTPQPVEPAASETPESDACQGSDGTISECDELVEKCRDLERRLHTAEAERSKDIAKLQSLRAVENAQAQSDFEQMKEDRNRLFAERDAAMDRVAKLEGALKDAQRTFLNYAAMHEAKNPPSTQKAFANRKAAQRIEIALQP